LGNGHNCPLSPSAELPPYSRYESNPIVRAPRSSNVSVSRSKVKRAQEVADVVGRRAVADPRRQPSRFIAAVHQRQALDRDRQDVSVRVWACRFSFAPAPDRLGVGDGGVAMTRSRVSNPPRALALTGGVNGGFSSEDE
jgi:hypothetical protein